MAYLWASFILVIGCSRMKQDDEWETSVPVAECNWKQIAEPVMQLYTETTDGSMIEFNETSMAWCYEDADPDFGSCQAKELLDHLESVLANEPVTVKGGSNYVEVKPQVCDIFFTTSYYFLVKTSLKPIENCFRLPKLR